MQIIDLLFDNNKFIIIKKSYNYYDDIYHFLMSKRIAKKTIKDINNINKETYDWSKLIYPKDLYNDDNNKIKNNIKEKFFGKMLKI